MLKGNSSPDPERHPRLILISCERTSGQRTISAFELYENTVPIGSNILQHLLFVQYFRILRNTIFPSGSSHEDEVIDSRSCGQVRILIDFRVESGQYVAFDILNSGRIGEGQEDCESLNFDRYEERPWRSAKRLLPKGSDRFEQESRYRISHHDRRLNKETRKSEC